MSRLGTKTEIIPDASIDTRGTYCPMPIVLAKQAIEKLALGEVLQVFSDDDGVLKDFPDWCARTGHEYLGTVEEDGEYRSLIRRGKTGESVNGGIGESVNG